MIALLAAAVLQCPDGTPPPCGREAARAPAANSIAVLYFANTSRDSADDYLADGLTEEIILRLQQVPRLTVKSRFESQRVRGRRVAPATLGRQLGARYLVNGTIQRAGERLVVRVELTRADQGVGVWSERYDRTSASVLDVIDDVARGVASGVAGQLLPEEVASLSRRPTVDPGAYEAFVRGNVYLAQRSSSALARAAAQYAAAYERDPRLRIALAREAYAYALGIALGVGDLPRDSVVALADVATERARRLAADLADTWIAEGFRLLVRALLLPGEDRLLDGVAALARAVAIDPRSAEARHQYGQGLAVAGPDSAALAEYRRALELEPGRAVTWEELGRLYLVMGRFAEARDAADSAIAADPHFLRGLLMRARARVALGDVSGAERDVMAASASARGFNAVEARVMRAIVLAARGDTAEARRIADAPGLPPYTIYLGEMLVAVGRPEVALDRIADRPSAVHRCYMLRFPLLATLRGQPRYDRMTAGCATTARAPGS